MTKRKGVITMKRRNYRSLNMDKIKMKKTRVLSSSEALKDVIPPEWDKEVLSGAKKITLSGLK